jgi:hypothetical protein
MSRSRQFCFALLALALLAGFAASARADIAPYVMCNVHCANGFTDVATAASCMVCFDRCRLLCQVPICEYGEGLNDRYACSSLDSGDLAAGSALFGMTAQAPRCTAPPAPQISR